MRVNTRVTEAQRSKNLVERIILGDQSAETEMVNCYQSRLFNTVYKQAWDKDLTNDIVQETWMIAIKKIRASELVNQESLGSFITRIGSNQLIMHYRKNSKIPFSSDENLQEITDGKLCPYKEIDSEQLMKKILSVLSQMKVERDRTLLFYFYLIGDSKQQLCQKHEINPVHFDRVIYRARNRFKVLWQQHTKVKEHSPL